jgi:hypothetical protein
MEKILPSSVIIINEDSIENNIEMLNETCHKEFNLIR